MSFILPAQPSAKAYIEETADFWEIEALRKPDLHISHLHIAKIIGIELDEIDHEGIVSEDDQFIEKLDSVFQELESRIIYTWERYPFQFSKNSIKLEENDTLEKLIYIFLLLSTRFNMSNAKKQGDIDATHVFERLCVHVLKNYFGKNSESIILGTASPGSFEDKVNDLTKRIGEGTGFKNPDNNPAWKNDGGIDVVVWKEFNDKSIGKLIGFGQCKTGTSTWRDERHKLSPESFCTNWLIQSPVFIPIKILLLCDTMNREKNFYTDQQGFLAFNRFRIMEYIPDDIVADKGLLSDIETWVSSALVKLRE